MIKTNKLAELRKVQTHILHQKKPGAAEHIVDCAQLQYTIQHRTNSKVPSYHHLLLRRCLPEDKM